MSINEQAFDCLLNRRSTRAYTDRIPDDAAIRRVVDAGLMAPSGMGRQDAIVLIIKSKIIRDELSALNARVMNGKDDPFYGAPVVLVVLAPENSPSAEADGSAVMMNMLNAAHAAGLSSCWIGRAKQSLATTEGKSILTRAGIPAGFVGIGNCILGYAAAPAAAAAPRKEGRVYCIA